MTRDTSKPPYGAVLRAAEAYERARNKYVSGNYRVFRAGDPTYSPNWKFFEKVATLLAKMSVSPAEWMEAQFMWATSRSYPYPSNLATKRARERYNEYATMLRVEDFIGQYEWYLNHYCHRHSLKPHEVVLIPALPFRDWFRAVHAKDPIPKDIARVAQKELEIMALRKGLLERDYDVVELDRRIGESLNAED